MVNFIEELYYGNIEPQNNKRRESRNYSREMKVLSENEDMSYCVPKQGTNVAVDAMVIPANANNPKLANVFIRYMLGHDACLANSLEVGYASPNAEVLSELSGPGGDFEGNVAYMPRSGYEKDEVYVDLPEEWQARQPDMWAKIMAE